MNEIPYYALYGETRPANELDFIHIEAEAHGGRDLSAGLEIRPHRHENLHQFLYLERGRILLRLDAAEQWWDGPCLVSIPPMTVHSIQIDPGSTRYVLTVSQAFISRLFLERAPLHVEQLLVRPATVKLDPATYPGDQIHGLMMLMRREFFSHLEGRTSLISASLTTLFIQLGRLVGSEDGQGAQSPQYTEIYNRFRSALEQHYRDHWGVRHYAELLGVTEDRLNKVCKLAAGHTCLQIIHSRLLMEAKRNLVYTDKSISSIAYDLGFGDPNYFSRFFRKYAGETASAFKARFQRSL